MSNNPYIPEILDEPTPPSSFGLLCGLLCALGLQAGAVFLVVGKDNFLQRPASFVPIILGCWFLSYLLGAVLNSRLASDQELTPSGRPRWDSRGYRSADQAAAEDMLTGTVVAVLQFFCGAVYLGVNGLLGRR